MTVRMPKTLFGRAGLRVTGESTLETEILAEKAAALGRTGAAVADALAALDAYPHKDEHRVELVQHAADAVLYFFVQRELCGFSDQAEAIKDYKIPKEVLARVGVT